MSSLPVPFHFTATFLVTVAAGGAVWVAFARPQFVPPGRWMRRAFGLGWLLLGLAELMHGSLIVGSELEQAAVALRGGAYALLVGSLLPPERASKKPKASAAVGATTGVALPGFLAVAAAWFAFRNPLPAARRLATAFSLFAVSEILFGTVDSLTTTEPGILWFIAHGTRLAGGIAVGTWLWGIIRTSIQARFVAVMIALTLVVVVSIAGFMTQVFASNVTEEALSRAADEGRVQQRLIDDQIVDFLSSARLVAELESVRRAVATRDEALIAQVKRLQAPGGPFDDADFLAYVDPSGGLLTMSAESPQGLPNLLSTDAISLAGTAVVQTALQDRQQAGSIDTLGPQKVVIVAAHPVDNPPGVDPPGAPIGLAGVVVMGQIIDDGYLQELRVEDEQEAFLIKRDAVVASTIRTIDLTGVLPSPPEPMLISVFEQGQIFNTEGQVGDDQFFSSYIPLERTDNEVVAALVIGQRSEVLNLTQRDVGRTLFLLATLATLMAIGLSYLSGKRITRPIMELTTAAERVRSGDLTGKLTVDSQDEVGRLGEMFGQMTTSLSTLTDQLRSERNQLDIILQSMADGVVAVDQDHQVVAINKEAERILGISSEESMGRAVREIIRMTDQSGKSVEPPIFTLSAGALSGMVGSKSRQRPVAVTSAPISDLAGEVIGGVAVIRDMTRELEVEKMKTEFLSNISHELRTPLTPIKGYSDILRRRNVPRQQAVTFLDGIITGARRLERIVEMLVDFSAMEAGRLVPRPVPMDLGRSITELIAEWEKEAPKHRFEKKGLSRLQNVVLDPRLVPLAVGELIDNAVKFSPKGGKIVVTGEIEAGNNGNGTLRVSVSDQGIGIEKKDLARIGEDFVQVDGSETRSYGGLGLGLAYVRRIVDAHNGKLQVTSTPNRGSRFTLEFPAIPITGKGSAKAKRATPVPRARVATKSSRTTAKKPINKKRAR